MVVNRAIIGNGCLVNFPQLRVAHWGHHHQLVKDFDSDGAYHCLLIRFRLINESRDFSQESRVLAHVKPSVALCSRVSVRRVLPGSV
ncbi:Uncharacterised protein [Enterobacter cloacae]|nr:Uncharacterised protein [Enterobacter cloacae]